MTYDERVAEVCERAIQKRDMPLRELIASENLQTYSRGHVDILYGDDMNNAMVPCCGHMILTRDRYSKERHDFVAEYAIYRRKDMDSFGEDISNMNGNVFLCEAVYELMFVSDETFDSMADAISFATGLIHDAKSRKEV